MTDILSAEDRALLREVFSRARAEGWRPAGELRDRQFRIWEWRRGNQRIHLRGADHSMFADLRGGSINVAAAVGRAGFLVNLIVDCGWLPEHLHSKYRAGLGDGRQEVRDAVHACAEFGEGSHAFFHMADTMPVLVDALTYWRSIAGSNDVQAEIGDKLGRRGLLDRHPYARREQAGEVTDTVFDATEAHRG